MNERKFSMTEITPQDTITNKNATKLVCQQWSKVPNLIKIDSEIKPFHLEGDTARTNFQLGWINFNGIIVPLALIIIQQQDDLPKLHMYFQNIYNRQDPIIKNLVNHFRKSYHKKYDSFEKYLMGGSNGKNKLPGTRSLTKWLNTKLTFDTNNILLLLPGFEGIKISQKQLKKIYFNSHNLDWSQITH